MAPVFASLLMRDPSGRSWLERLLALPRRYDGQAPSLPACTAPLTRCAWWPDEERLPPPPSLLAHLVESLPTRPDANEWRQRLMRREPEALVEARRLLAARDPRAVDRAWYVFEGPTSVDAYLESEDVVVVIEGKRTESGPTTSTTWMETRHQILRNIDSAWERRDGRAVCGFFIVEGLNGGRDVSAEWKEFTRATVSREALDGSLPHRTMREREAMSASFLGVTTWQEVVDEFSLRVRLPDEIEITFAPTPRARSRPGDAGRS